MQLNQTWVKVRSRYMIIYKIWVSLPLSRMITSSLFEFPFIKISLMRDFLVFPTFFSKFIEKDSEWDGKTWKMIFWKKFNSRRPFFAFCSSLRLSIKSQFNNKDYKTWKDFAQQPTRCRIHIMTLSQPAHDLSYNTNFSTDNVWIINEVGATVSCVEWKEKFFCAFISIFFNGR